MGRIVERAMGRARGGWGFCTIRRIAAACRRRVASLLVQFPPRDREESGKPREARWGGEWGTPWGTAGSAMGRIVERAMGRARGGWGFCTIRRIAAACRRRVESLLTQFPPRDREGSGEPRGARRGARWGGLWSGPWGAPGADGGFAPLDASLRRVAGVSRPYWCNSPLATGKRAGNPVGHGGERRGEDCGAGHGARPGRMGVLHH